MMSLMFQVTEMMEQTLVNSRTTKENVKVQLQLTQVADQKFQSLRHQVPIVQNAIRSPEHQTANKQKMAHNVVCLRVATKIQL